MTRGTLPPRGLPGLTAEWSRLVTVDDALTGTALDWHLLDTGPALAAAGIVPGATILAVHGNPTWSYLWRHVAAESLARARAGGRAWRLIAVDQLEMGYSARSGARRTLPDRVRDLSALTDALGIDGPVVTLGHDWGGVISLGWAVDHPAALAGVVLTNTAVHPVGGMPAALQLALGLARFGTRDTTAFLDTTLAIAHPALAPEVRDAYRSPYRAAARRSGIAGFVTDIPAHEQHESRAELDRIAEGVRGIRVPALVLWGPRDPVFQERYLRDILGRLPHADVHRFDGAGHLLPEDAPVADTVLDWLERFDRADDAVPATASPEPAGLWSALDARRHDDALALAELGTGRRLSWASLTATTERLARGLTAVGVRPGHRVSLLVPPGADLTAALYACVRIGAVVVVADAGLGLRGLTRAVRGAGPDWIIGVPRALAAAAALGWPGTRILAGGSPGAARALGAIDTLAGIARRGELTAPTESRLPDWSADDALAAVLFTSGSTGPAKGVRYTHGALGALAATLRERFGLGPHTGLVAGFAPFALLGPALGARTATPVMDVTSPATLTAKALADAILAVDADVVFLSPAALANVASTRSEAEQASFAAVRLVLSAGAPLSAAAIERAAGVFPNASVHTPYGMTEGLLVTDVTLEEIQEAGEAGGVTVGAPAGTARIRIAPLDALGMPARDGTTEPGVTGEILVSAPHLLQGYDRLWRTDRAARADAGGERWHRTGDVGHLDAAGRLVVEGRLPHVIVRADGVVTPVAVEHALERIPGVARAAAVGVGPRGTQQLVAIVEPAPGARRIRAGLAQAALAAAARSAVVRSGIRAPLAAVLVVRLLPTDIRHNSKVDRARLASWATGVLAGGRVRQP